MNFCFQSEGNVDNSLYAVKPDRSMELTPKGMQQAYVRTVGCKDLIEEWLNLWPAYFVETHLELTTVNPH